MAESLRRRPTIRDVARHAGVSKSLVSLVLSNPDRVGPQRREKVEASIRALGYQPNLAARSLASENPRAIGVVLGELHNPWVLEVAEVVRDELQEAGFDVLFSAAPAHEGRGVESSSFQALRDLRVSGFLVVGTVDENSGFEVALDGAQAVFIGKRPGCPGFYRRRRSGRRAGYCAGCGASGGRRVFPHCSCIRRFRFGVRQQGIGLPSSNGTAWAAGACASA